MTGLGLACCCLAVVLGQATIRPDLPNAITFPAEEARFVRLRILATASGEPCLDELELYGPAGKENLALAERGAKAKASSCLSGYAQHAIEHLNDGQYGNQFSWIAASRGPEWAEIELPRPTRIDKLVFSRDREGQYVDRVPTSFEVLLSSDGVQWKLVKTVVAKAATTAVRRAPGRFAGVVPSAPPPPRVTKQGLVVSTATIDRVPSHDELGFANLARGAAAKAAASSALTGYAIHQVAHLNDGQVGNSHSWISGQDPSWAEIDLGDTYWIYKVALGSDSSGQYRDRAPTSFRVLTATKYSADTAASSWTPVIRQTDGAPVHARTEFKFPPVQARWVRVAITAATTPQVRLDELEVYGQKAPLPLDKLGPFSPSQAIAGNGDEDAMLRYAFLSEEHAWLKTYGRADLSSRLVPYNGRVKEYPRHVGDDRLPLPSLSNPPKLDGKLDDACWAQASRGTVSVVHLDEFDEGPLVNTTVRAGWNGQDLLLAIETDRLLSGHVAVISTTDGRGCGVVAYGKTGLVFNTYVLDGPRKANLAKSTPINGAFNEALTCCEMRLPLAWFPDCREQGLRIGLGMGGHHTLPEGRPVHFVFSPLAIAEISPCTDRVFRVRLAAAPGGKAIQLTGNLPGKGSLALQPGESRVLNLPADRGPIGPQYNLAVRDQTGEEYQLHLFRYDPLERTLTLMEELTDRQATKNLSVDVERKQLTEFRLRQKQFLQTSPNLTAERQLFFAARKAKRQLFFREPELQPIERILFVKRHAYEPSHNYSVMLDARYRPGGGVYLARIPRINGRYEPGRMELKELFTSGGGIARDPMADFDLSKVYFAYRPSADGYFHVMRMDPDGGQVTKLTDGPFHDYWPCPLPDGGLAMISSRCRARFLCWRPQAAVLFRMDANGDNIQPLSYANLTEWGPSVTSDGRIIWQRSEYVDKGADFSHTLWTIHPDGTMPELVYGNTIIQPNGYANGREVPGTREICCTLISHFGDLNGPIALVDIDKGRFNPKAITSLTPEVPWPGMWPSEEYFRDPFPIARDYILCSHAPRDRAGVCVIDRFGNRELLLLDATYGCMTPTPYRRVTPPPVLCGNAPKPDEEWGQFAMADVYRGIDAAIPRGKVKYLRVVEEVRAELEALPTGGYRKDHEPFMHFYATPTDRVSGPCGWPSYVAKAPWGLVPVEEDGSAYFYAPAGKQLYFQILDKDLNELQRMRSVVQVQPGEKRSCIGCHEERRHAPPARMPLALRRAPSEPETPPWGAGPFSYEHVVQPVLTARCVTCHDSRDPRKLDLTGTLDRDGVPASYRTLIQQGWVNYCDFGYNSGGNEKKEPLSFGTLKSKLWNVLDRGHFDVRLTRDEMHALKCWIDLNCPLWPDYQQRELRRGPESPQLTRRP